MLRGFVSLSAVDKESAESYMKIIMSFVMAYDFDYEPGYKRKTNMWFAKIDPFVTRFKLKRSILQKAHKKLLAGADPSKDDDYAELIIAVIADLKDKTPAMKKELDLRKEDLSLLNDLRLILVKQSDSAYKRVSKVVTRFRDPDINEMFIEDHSDISDERSELEELVTKYVGAPGLVIPLTVLQQWQKVAALKGKKLADHERYLKLKRTLTDTYKTRLKSLVRSSGKHYLPVHEVIEALDAENIPHTLPADYIGLVDDAGKFYTTVGKQLTGAPSGKVTMNPEYVAKEDNAYVCQFLPFGAKDLSKVYTLDYRANSKIKKFGAVQKTMPMLASLAKKWRADMKSPNTQKGMTATVLEFIFATSARPGNPGNATQGERTFGATQLQVQHMKIDTSKIVAQYKGKSQSSNTQALQKHVINYNDSAPLKLMAKNLKLYMAGKKAGDDIFVYKGKTLNSTAVTRYMKTLGFPDGFTVHKFRTVRATKMTADILKKSPFVKGGDWKERDVNNWVEEQLLHVGTALGHTSKDKITTSTAIGSYIEPAVLAEFYNKLGIRPPAKIQKAIDASIKSKD